MTETREVFDPFDGKTVQIRNDLVRRLRGQYACGPTLASGEPEFGWRQFETPPIQHEAADEIDHLRSALTKVADLVDSEADEPLDDAISIARKALNDGPSKEG